MVNGRHQDLTEGHTHAVSAHLLAVLPPAASTPNRRSDETRGNMPLIVGEKLHPDQVPAQRANAEVRRILLQLREQDPRLSPNPRGSEAWVRACMQMRRRRRGTTRHEPPMEPGDVAQSQWEGRGRFGEGWLSFTGSSTTLVPRIQIEAHFRRCGMGRSAPVVGRRGGRIQGLDRFGERVF